jgi:hypothetical protein
MNTFLIILGCARMLICMPPILNFSTRKIGGVRFVKLGRLFFSFGISRKYRPL